ncbi:MAG TPA: hypothetical protein VFD26_12195 [Methyloceanibacter sp.]|nr:hypothetical protein [Methyloceanibacter sp.]
MRRKPPGEGIDPLRAGDEQLERRRGLDIGDADGENRFLLADGARSTSRATKAESLEAFDSTSTKLRVLSMPPMISSP